MEQMEHSTGQIKGARDRVGDRDREILPGARHVFSELALLNQLQQLNSLIMQGYTNNPNVEFINT